MAGRDLRQHLTRLAELNLLREVTCEVDREWEVSCIARLLFFGHPEARRPALHFTRIKGFAEGSIVVGAIGASPEVLAEVARCGPGREELHGRWRQALASPLPPIAVATGPCKEVVHTGNQVDLGSLPVPTWTPGKDGGPYLTPLWVTRDPDSGRHNLGMYRCQVKGRDRTGIQWGRPEFQHAGIHLARWHARGEAMPAAIVVGGDPALYLPGTTKIPYDMEEYAIAGALTGDAVELVRGETVDLLVPATAEVVIEGEFRPGEMEAEGPFGEYTGYMANSPGGQPLFRVRCVTHRRHPILLGILSQMPPSEGLFSNLLWEGIVLHYLKEEARLPGILDIHQPVPTGEATLWVRMDSHYLGHPRQVAYAIWGRFGWRAPKFIFLTDGDVDIRDPFAREWAFTFRVRPERDIHLIPDVPALTLDPSAAPNEEVPSGERVGAKAIIDATKKRRDFPVLALPKQAHLEEALRRWERYGLPSLERYRLPFELT